MIKERILIIDDDPDIRRILEHSLSHAGYIVYTAINGTDGFKKAEEIIPDLILLDIMMPRQDGYEVKKMLLGDKSLATIPVIMLSAKDNTEDKVAGFGLGVDDYITKPFDLAELLARVKSTIRRRKDYEEMSMTDALTGVYNVHYYKKQVAMFFNLARRHHKTFSLVIVDIDSFKTINDCYGHLFGDYVIKTIPQVIKKVVRVSDILVRYGGDEFVLILPETSAAQADIVVKKINEHLEAEKFVVKKTGDQVIVSVTAGIAEYNDRFTTDSQMFDAADEAMFMTKKQKKAE